jgi:hypothetical protein
MKYPDASFIHVAAALALHIIPEPDQVVKGKSFISIIWERITC